MGFLSNRITFRSRLAVAFVVVGAVSSGALAGIAFLVTRENRLNEVLERNLQRARSNLVAASLALTEDSLLEDARSLVSAYQGAANFDLAIELGSFTEATNGRFSDPDVVPESLRNVGNEITYERTLIDGRQFLVVAGEIDSLDANLYFFFPEGELQATLSELGRVLFVGWLVIVAASGLVGILLAKRVMAPVAQASDAARSLAEGLLDTRLPVQTDDEFGGLAGSFNEMAQALEQKITELSEAREREQRFTADVAHELRTPIAALVSEASFVRDQLDEVPASMRRAMELLIDDVTRLRQLIEDLLEISVFDARRQTLEVEELDVRAVLTSMLRRRGWNESVSVDAEPVVLHTDRRRLERIVSNLIGNAIKYSRRDVDVRLRRSEQWGIIEVSDDGPGIPQDRLPHVFDRFYKLDPARSGSGSGLGLSIAHENAKFIGARIEVRSQVGVGSTFVILLPLDRHEEPNDPSGEPGRTSRALRSAV